MRRAVVAIVVVLALATAAMAQEKDRTAVLDRALHRATSYLVAAQSEDGAWRSKTYAALRDGHALTPYVMSTLWFLPQGGTRGRASFRKGVAYLGSYVTDEGRLRLAAGELSYPSYSAAMASRVVVLESRDARNRAVRRAWLGRVRAHRLGPEHGWSPDDPAYGGWGYSISLPRRSAPGELRTTLPTSNLSATLFGLAALRSAKTPDDDPVWKEALGFLARCQNLASDGGFFFAPGDDIGNKAGAAGKDGDGRTRYRSYGSMTADGVRALLLAGLPATHPRVAAARTWLEREFRADRNPGRFATGREDWREATYYYWAWSVAHAFARLEVRTIQRGATRVDWAKDLAFELLRRQREDGTWRNDFTASKEDDPLVATPWAASALAICRAMMAGGPVRRNADYPTLGDR